MAGELDTKRDRVEFMRLLLTDNIERSTDFSRILLKHINRKLGIPTISSTEVYDFLEKNAVKIETGIYARNLSMTRLVHCPVSYGEILCLDNENECIALSKTKSKNGQFEAPKRVQQIATVYADAIVEYFNPDETEETISPDDLEEVELN